MLQWCLACFRCTISDLSFPSRQQPGVMHSPPPTSRGGRSGGGSSSDGRRGDSGGRGRPRYNPY